MALNDNARFIADAEAAGLIVSGPDEHGIFTLLQRVNTPRSEGSGLVAFFEKHKLEVTGSKNSGEDTLYSVKPLSRDQ